MNFFVRFLRSIWGVCRTRRGVSLETEENRANLCLVVDCFRGQIHQSREAGPPERPQPEARRPLAQSRPPTTPQKTIKAVANPVFHSSLSPKPHEHRPGDGFAQKFDRCIRVASGRVGLRGGASPPKTPQGAIASYPMLAKRVCRWPRRSGEETLRRSPRWSPTGVS